MKLLINDSHIYIRSPFVSHFLSLSATVTYIASDDHPTHRRLQLLLKRVLKSCYRLRSMNLYFSARSQQETNHGIYNLIVLN